MKTLHLYIRILAAASHASMSRHHLKSRHLRSILGVLFVIVSSVSNIEAQANGYFYVADIDNPQIAVYDHNLVFRHYIFGDSGTGQFGLDFLSNGNLVAAARGPGRVVIYDPSGTVASTFTPPTLGGGTLHDVKAGSSDLLYIGGTDGIMEFTTNGSLIRTLPTLGNQAIAVLPGNILWAAGPFLSGIDVFDLLTGNRVATIPLSVSAMSFSPSTGTVLICSDIPYELTLSGAVVRSFPGGPCSYGVTRGPNGDVYSTAIVFDDESNSYLTFERWNANGEHLGSTDLSGAWPGNIVWSPHDIPEQPTNRSPVLSNVPTSATVNEGETYSFTATATDPDGDVLRFSISTYMQSQGASIDPVTGVFSWTPSEWQVGTYGFEVLVRDDDVLRPIVAGRSISITINEVNSPPVLGAISNLTGYTMNSIAFTATATDSDIPANTLTFSLIGAPAGVSINPFTGFFSWRPTNKQIGQYTFTVRVSDNGSPALTDEQTVTVTVSRARGR